MTAGSSHDDGFGPKDTRRPQPSPSLKPPVPHSKATALKSDAELEFDPTLPALETLELDATLPPPSNDSIDPAPTLAPETPLPRCLTDAVLAGCRAASPASQIPPAPKLPRFSLPAARSTPTTDEPPPNSEACLGLPTDRVLPGSPALVSTFRPKPQMRSGYSVTHTCQEERVYTPKRARRAKPPAKRHR